MRAGLKRYWEQLGQQISKLYEPARAIEADAGELPGIWFDACIELQEICQISGYYNSPGIWRLNDSECIEEHRVCMLIRNYCLEIWQVSWHFREFNDELQFGYTHDYRLEGGQPTAFGDLTFKEQIDAVNRLPRVIKDLRGYIYEMGKRTELAMEVGERLTRALKGGW